MKPLKTPIDENSFVLGIDIGNDSSSISFFNAATKQADVIDLSGGYGKPSIPTAMQYIPETKEWVYGEYALTNSDTAGAVLVTGLVERLGKCDYFDISGRSVSAVTLLGMFIKALVGHVYNINPRAEIVGIIAAIPSYLGDEATNEFLQAFQKAGLEKELIGFVSDRECVLHNYLHSRRAGVVTPYNRLGNIMMLDFGARALRGVVFETMPSNGGQTQFRSTSSFFDTNISSDAVNTLVRSLFTHFYCDNYKISPEKLSAQTKAQLNTFAYQHRDILFQKSIKTKPARLYFNFAHPAFSRSVDTAEAECLICGLKSGMEDFIAKLLNNLNAGGREMQPADIQTVLAFGGGFEMLWARNFVKDTLPNSDVHFYKNSKVCVSEGAAIAAAHALSLLPEHPAISIQDLSRLDTDIGVMVTQQNRERFVPIAPQNSFWWQMHAPLHFILGEATDNPIGLKLFKRGANGNITSIDDISLEGLPHRPRNATRISVEIAFDNYNSATCRLTDLGFGDMFPTSGISAEKNFVI